MHLHLIIVKTEKCTSYFQGRLLNPISELLPLEPELRNDVLVKYIYTRHKGHGIDMKRSILRFIVYPHGYEFVHNMCMTQFSGRGMEGTWANIRPHGNAKGREQYLGAVNPHAKQLVFEFFDKSYKVSGVLAKMSALQDPLKITQRHRIKYLYKKWCEEKNICCNNNPSQQLSHIVEGMKTSTPMLVRSVHQSAEGNPVITICPEWVQTLMQHACGIRTRKLKHWTPSDLDVGKLNC